MSYSIVLVIVAVARLAMLFIIEDMIPMFPQASMPLLYC